MIEFDDVFCEQLAFKASYVARLYLYEAGFAKSLHVADYLESEQVDIHAREVVLHVKCQVLQMWPTLPDSKKTKEGIFELFLDIDSGLIAIEARRYVACFETLPTK